MPAGITSGCDGVLDMRIAIEYIGAWRFRPMAEIIEKVKRYKSEIQLAALYVYVAILAVATLKELGVI